MATAADDLVSGIFGDADPTFVVASIGGYSTTVSGGEVVLADAISGYRPSGLSLEVLGNKTLDSLPITARFYVDDDGNAGLEALDLFGWVTSRPLLGDSLDWGLLGGDFELDVMDPMLTDSGVLRVYAPSNLVFFGLSNTDMDDTRGMEPYRSIGSGLGVEAYQRIGGPVTLHSNAELSARTLNRRKPNDLNDVRHEVRAKASFGLGWTSVELSGLLLNGWAELITQWETRDDDGPNGVDRQAFSAGLSLTFLRRNGWSTAAAVDGQPTGILSAL